MPLVGFLGISILSFLSYIPSYFAQFATKKQPNFFFLICFAVLLLPFIATPLSRLINSLINFKSIRQYRYIVPIEIFLANAGLVYWAVIGLLAAFIFHFAMLMPAGDALEYLLFDWRMIFLKVSIHNTPTAGVLHQFRWNFLFHLLHLSFWFIAVVYNWKRLPSRKKSFIAAYTLIILASLFLVSRGRVQDSLWNDVLIIWGFRLVLPMLTHFSRWVLPAAGLLLVGWNCTHFKVNSADGVNYAPQPLARFWQEPYESPVNRYSEIMQELKQNPETYERTNQLAVIHPSLKAMLNKMWSKPRPDLRHLNLTSTEFRQYIWVKPIKQESTIRPGDLVIWLGAEDLENYTDCPLNPTVVTREKVRWRQIHEGTKKCRVLSENVKVAINIAHLINQAGKIK